MTLASALRSARGRRLRPERYNKVASGVIAFFLTIVVVQVGANIYMASQLSSGNGAGGTMIAGLDGGPQASRFYTQVILAWCALFAGSVTPVVAYRGIARTARNSRLRLFPLPPRRLFRTALAVSLVSVPVIATVAAGALQVILSVAAGSGRSLIDFLLFLVVGGACFVLTFAVAWRLRVGESFLELIEVALLALMIVANPDPSLRGGHAHIALFIHLDLSHAHLAAVALIPVAGALLTTVALLISALFSLQRKRMTSEGRHIGFVLYRSRMPMGLFVMSYAIELPVILGNPALMTTVRKTVLIMLAVRLYWFVSYLFRAEQAISEVVHAPSRRAFRSGLYLRPALFHLILCVLPVVLFLLRLAGWGR